MQPCLQMKWFKTLVGLMQSWLGNCQCMLSKPYAKPVKKRCYIFLFIKVFSFCSTLLQNNMQIFSVVEFQTLSPCTYLQPWLCTEHSKLQPPSSCIWVGNTWERSQVLNKNRFSERKVVQFLRTCLGLFLVFLYTLLDKVCCLVSSTLYVFYFC